MFHTSNTVSLLLVEKTMRSADSGTMFPTSVPYDDTLMPREIIVSIAPPGARIVPPTARSHSTSPRQAHASAASARSSSASVSSPSSTAPWRRPASCAGKHAGAPAPCSPGAPKRSVACRTATAAPCVLRRVDRSVSSAARPRSRSVACSQRRLSSTRVVSCGRPAASRCASACA